MEDDQRHDELTDATGGRGPALSPGPARRPGRPSGLMVGVGVAVVALLVGGTALGLAVDNAGGAEHPAPAKVTCGSGQARLTVVGTGQAMATPDLLTAVMGVTATAGSATAALNQDSTEAAAVIAALTQNGVARADVATTGLTLQTQYGYPHGVPTITGYQVANTVTATLRQISTAGPAIDAVVGVAGNAVQLNSLTFSFAHPGTVEDEARTDAVHQAVSHARAMALAAGQRLGPVCSLTDQVQTPYLQQNEELSGNVAASAAKDAVSVPLEPGTQTESDQVTLVYAVS